MLPADCLWMVVATSVPPGPPASPLTLQPLQFRESIVENSSIFFYTHIHPVGSVFLEDPNTGSDSIQFLVEA